MIRTLLLLSLLSLPFAALSVEDGPTAKTPMAAETGEADAAKPALPKPPSKRPPSRKQLKPLISKMATSHGIERALALAVIKAESNYNAHAVSTAGAVGLMQLMPATAADYGVTSTHALFDPKTNLRAGMRHLKRLLRKYKGDLGRVVMAYNAGEGIVDRTNGFVTYPETLNYTGAVMRNYVRYGGKKPVHATLRRVAMLKAAQPGSGLARAGKSGRQRVLLRRINPKSLSLQVRPTLSRGFLDPSALRAGPESKPMFELK